MWPRAGGLAALVRGRRAAPARSGGGVAALTQVYEQHHQALYRYCRALLRDEHDAQDALQSTMTRAFAALQDEQRDFELRPWLFRIAHNEAVSMLRRRRPADELDELSATAPAVEDQVALNADLETLRGDLDALPQRQRAALLLRELNGLSHQEIGQALDCRPDLVKQTIYQARAGLMQAREGREMECGEIRKALSDGDGRILRGMRIQAHLRSCAGCRAFRDDLTRRPAELALLAPPLPVAAGAALLERLLPGAGAGTAGVMAALAPKAITTLAVVAATAAGATTVIQHQRPASRPATPPAKQTPSRAAAPAAFTGAARSGGGSSSSVTADPAGMTAAKSRGRSDQAKSRGRSDEAKSRRRSDEAKSRRRSDEAKSRGRSDEAKSRGRDAAAGRGDDAGNRGRSEAAKTRSRSAEAKTRSRSAEAKTRSRPAAPRSGSRSAEAQTRSRSAEATSRAGSPATRSRGSAAKDRSRSGAADSLSSAATDKSGAGGVAAPAVGPVRLPGAAVGRR